MAAARILMIGSSSYYSSPDNQRARTMDPTTQILPRSFPTVRTTRLLLARASNLKPEGQEEEEDNNDYKNNAFSSPEDLNYLWKLGAGSLGGAAVIKYGSILFPEITRPNIIEALIIISTPVIVAVLLLIKQSRAMGQNKGPF